MVYQNPPEKINLAYFFYSKTLKNSIGIEQETINKLAYILNEDGRYNDIKISGENIIWVFYYWKHYLSIEQVCYILDITSRTFHNYYSKTLDALYYCCKKILNERYDRLVDEFVDIISYPLSNKEYRSIAADSTPINIQKPTNYSTRKMYFHEKKKYQVKFHVEVEIRTRKLLMVSKGYEGSISDNKIADIYIEKDENNQPKYYINSTNPIRIHDKYPILGDKGYVGLKNFITPFKIKKEERKKGNVSDDILIHNSFVSSNRIYVENFFLKPKNEFNVLGSTFRGDLKDLEKIVLVIFFALDLENDAKLEAKESIEYIQQFDQKKLDEIKKKILLDIITPKKRKKINNLSNFFFKYIV